MCNMFVKFPFCIDERIRGEGGSAEIVRYCYVVDTWKRSYVRKCFLENAKNVNYFG